MWKGEGVLGEKRMIRSKEAAAPSDRKGEVGEKEGGFRERGGGGGGVGGIYSIRRKNALKRISGS